MPALKQVIDKTPVGLDLIGQRGRVWRAQRNCQSAWLLAIGADENNPQCRRQNLPPGSAQGRHSAEPPLEELIKRFDLPAPFDPGEPAVRRAERQRRHFDPINPIRRFCIEVRLLPQHVRQDIAAGNFHRWLGMRCEMPGKGLQVLITPFFAAFCTNLDNSLLRIAGDTDFQNFLNGLSFEAFRAKCQFAFRAFFDVNGRLRNSALRSRRRINANRLKPISFARSARGQVQDRNRVGEKPITRGGLIQDPPLAIVRKLKPRPLLSAEALQQGRLHVHPFDHLAVLRGQHKQHILHAFQTFQINTLATANLLCSHHAIVIRKARQQFEFCLHSILPSVGQLFQQVFDGPHQNRPAPLARPIKIRGRFNTPRLKKLPKTI